MKIVCIDDKGYITKEKIDGITEGKVYDVVGGEFDTYNIIDDNGKEHGFFRPRFKKVESEKVDIVGVKFAIDVYVEETSETIKMDRFVQVNDDNFKNKIEDIKQELTKMIVRTKSLSEKEFINACIGRADRFIEDQYPIEENWFGTMKFEIKMVDAVLTTCKKDGVTIDF